LTTKNRSEAATRGVSFTHPLVRDVTYDRDGTAHREAVEAQEMNLLLPGNDSGPAGASQTRRTDRTAAHRQTPAPKTPATRSVAAKPSTTVRKKPAAMNLAIMALVVPALFCTVALPAYAYSPNSTDAGAEATAALSDLREDGAQSIAVSEEVALAAPARDEFTATSAAELRRAQLRVQYAAYAGPSVKDYLANPPYPSFSLDQVVAVALQYQGVPYRYGGANPSGFDCSGFTQFVYAQFGVALPHSSSRQGAGGAKISPADALPGDLVAMDGGGHIGIYLGGGMMIDAPRPGTTVQVRAIYNPAHWFIRYGI
jgi:cell wall-associated NlpC family hydrolase